LAEFLPPPPATILDVGGGPGRYAIALAAQGYQVTLTDLSEANLGLAQEKAQAAEVTLPQIRQANALDLSDLETAGFTTLSLIGCEGIVAGHEEKVNVPQEKLAEQRALFFTKGQPCLRASPLTKQYG
jgi:cyclopropane fatty-acyl-phospholipid synthase-like methyltransferase